MYISLNIVQEISLKKIYDEVTEGIFDMNNVGILEEIEKKKKMGDVYTLLCLRSAVWLKEPMLFQNICSDAFRVQDCTGPRSAVGNVSGNRCESDCRSRGREFDPGPGPYFRGD